MSYLRLLLVARRTFPSYGWRTRWGWVRETARDG